MAAACPAVKAPDLEIVIVTYNCADFLRKCLRSLPAACGSLKWRCWIVDNASSDESYSAALESLPREHTMRNETNVGFARANNQALRRATGRYLLLLNPDTEPDPGALARLAHFMDTYPSAGACGPMLLNGDRTLQSNGRRFPTLWREFLAVTGLRRLNRRHFDTVLEYGRDNFDLEAEVDYLMGACLLVRSECAREVGLLSESYFMFYEEVDWCWRIRRAGWQIWYVPDSQVVHHWMGSVRLAPKKMTRALYRSQIQYFRRTSGALAASASLAIAVIGLLKNEIVHLGAALKRGLRRAGLLRDQGAGGRATST